MILLGDAADRAVGTVRYRPGFHTSATYESVLGVLGRALGFARSRDWGPANWGRIEFRHVARLEP